MRRLKTKQRLEKLNQPDSKEVVYEGGVIGGRTAPYDDDGEARELATKVRVKSMLEQSIPDFPSRPRKPNSHVTAKMLADYQFQESKPIEINGEYYRMHPASIPEPDFEQNILNQDDEIKRQMDVIVKDRKQQSGVLTRLEALLPKLQAEIKVIEDKYGSLLSKSVDKLNQAVGKERGRIEAEIDYLQNVAFPEAMKDVNDRKEFLQGRIQEVRTKLEADRARQEELAQAPALVKEAQLGVKERNKAKLREYEDNLKSLNRNYNLVQQPGESEEDYLARIREATKVIEDPNYVEDRFQLHEARIFKDNMRELIRDPSVIEYAYNKLFEENDASIAELNKIFALIKEKYVKQYKEYQLKDVDLVKFLTKVLEHPEEEVIQSPNRDIRHKIRTITGREELKKPTFLKEIREMAQFITLPLEFEVGTLRKGPRGSLQVVKRGETTPTRLETLSVEALKYLFIAVMTQLKDDNHELYLQKNEAINRITDQEYGEGLKLSNSVPFGRVEIDLHKLYYKNILSVKQHGAKLNYFKNSPVSDAFVSIIINIVKGKLPSSREIENLPELALYDALIHVAGLHKRVEHKKNHTVDHLKKRLDLIGGEIEAGNDNHALKEEMKNIVHKLYHLGQVGYADVNAFLHQFR